MPSIFEAALRHAQYFVIVPKAAVDLYQVGGLATALRLWQREAEGIHLGNLEIAYATLGDSQHAIEFYNQQLQIARESSI